MCLREHLHVCILSLHWNDHSHVGAADDDEDEEEEQEDEHVAVAVRWCLRFVRGQSTSTEDDQLLFPAYLLAQSKEASGPL